MKNMKRRRGENGGGFETWTSSTEARINHDSVEADRTWLAT